MRYASVFSHEILENVTEFLREIRGVPGYRTLGVMNEDLRRSFLEMMSAVSSQLSREKWLAQKNLLGRAIDKFTKNIIHGGFQSSCCFLDFDKISNGNISLATNRNPS